MIKSIVKFSQLEDRFDAEYYKPEYLSISNNFDKFGYHTLGDLIVDINRNPMAYGFSYIKEGIPLLRGVDVKAPFIDLSEVEYIDDLTHKKFYSTAVFPGDLVMTVRGTIGQVGYIDEKIKEANISPNLIYLRPKNKTIAKFLAVYLNSSIGQSEIKKVITGSVQGTITEPEILAIKIPKLPNTKLNEISELFEGGGNKSQAAVQKYQEAQELLNDYLGIKEERFDFPKTFSLNFSKLEDRFDGEFYQPKVLFDSPIFEKGTINLGEIASIKMGKTPSKQSYTLEGVRMLKVRDLTNKGIDWSENNRAFANLETWDKSEKSRVQESDILLISAAHQAYYIGKELDIVFDIPDKYNKKLLAVAEILIIRPNQKINPYVLLWYLRTPIAYKFIQQLITGETSHLYPKDLVNLSVPKKLLNFNNTNKIEMLTKESVLLQKESKQLLAVAKRKVEEMIEKGGD